MPPSRYRIGVRRALPLTPAFIAFGASYGVIAEAAGMGRAAPIALSLATFAGSAQFAAAAVLDDGGTVAAAFFAAVLLNARYVAIGLSVAGSLPRPVGRRFIASQLTVDESWALSSHGDGTYDAEVIVGAGGTLYVAWGLGTALGVLFGEVLGDPATLGLDAALAALFLGLLRSQVRDRLTGLAAAVGAGIALVLVPLAPAGVPILAASTACLLGLRRSQ